MNIYVSNLSHNVTEAELKALFEEYGRVGSTVVIKDKVSGESRGFGFVDMPSKTEAMTAIQALNGHDVSGRKLTVKEALPREDKKGTGKSFGSNRNSGFNSGNFNKR